MSDKETAERLASQIARDYAASILANPLDQGSVDALQRDLASQISKGFALGGETWPTFTNDVLDAWDRKRGGNDDTLRVIDVDEVSGKPIMKPRSQVAS